MYRRAQEARWGGGGYSAGTSEREAAGETALEAEAAEDEGTKTPPRRGRSRIGSPSEKTPLTGAVESGSPLRFVPMTFDRGSTDVPASG
jgi:hypothetical protein